MVVVDEVIVTVIVYSIITACCSAVVVAVTAAVFKRVRFICVSTLRLTLWLLLSVLLSRMFPMSSRQCLKELLMVYIKYLEESTKYLEK